MQIYVLHAKVCIREICHCMQIKYTKIFKIYAAICSTKYARNMHKYAS